MRWDDRLLVHMRTRRDSVVQYVCSLSALTAHGYTSCHALGAARCCVEREPLLALRVRCVTRGPPVACQWQCHRAADKAEPCPMPSRLAYGYASHGCLLSRFVYTSADGTTFTVTGHRVVYWFISQVSRYALTWPQTPQPPYSARRPRPTPAIFRTRTGTRHAPSPVTPATFSTHCAGPRPARWPPPCTEHP